MTHRYRCKGFIIYKPLCLDVHGKEEGVHPSIKAHITQKDGSTATLLIDECLIVILHSELN